jgi:CheY-like chemotaxis protein
VLIVEDDPNARRALSELLQEEGFCVDEAQSGLEALPKLTAFHPDLVLTDLRMPGMDGLELLRQVRAAEHPPAIVIMTGRDATARVAKAQGVCACLTKPIDLAALALILDQALAARKADSAGTRGRMGSIPHG